MKMKLLTLITFLISSHLVQAENHMLLIGGGGEPKGESTIFDSGMKKLGTNLKSANWNYQVSFNGGHAATEEILANHFPKSSPTASAFTNTNYDKMIKDYIEKINNNEIKSGDQLMIIINTHGSSASEGQLTHKVAAAGAPIQNADDLSGGSLVSLDEMQKIVKLTEQKGIKLAIVDLSCHSGKTLELKKSLETDSPNTCIVTATGPDHYGNAGPQSFSENFMEELKTGENLEDVFLKARLRSPFAEYPMISTEENDKIVKDIYEGITPYLYYYYPKQDKLTPYIVNNANAGGICRREENFDSLISNIDDMISLLELTNKLPAQKIQTKPKRNFFGFFSSKKETQQTNENKSLTYNYAEKLKKLLIEYKESQDKVIAASLAVDSKKLENIEEFTLPPQDNTLINLKTTYTWKDLLSMNIDKDLQAYIKWQKNEKNDRRKQLIQDGIDFLRVVNQRKLQIVNANPLLSTFQKDTEARASNIKNSVKITLEISQQEKLLYNAIYQKHKTSDPTKENPCKNITF